jgi:hypothetical protein
LAQRSAINVAPSLTAGALVDPDGAVVAVDSVFEPQAASSMLIVTNKTMVSIIDFVRI